MCIRDRIDLADGCVRVLLDVEERYYYEMLNEYAGEKIENAQELLHTPVSYTHLDVYKRQR